MSEAALPMPDDDSRPTPELVVPAGWKAATLGAPVPVVRCTYIFPDTHARPGEQCKKWSLRGTVKCMKHGGQLPDVQKHAQAVVEAARLRLIGSTDLAVDVLEDLMKNANSDAVKLGAARDVLDRAGIRGGVDVEVTHNVGQDPAQVLRERLAQVRTRVIDIQPEATHDTVDEDETPPSPDTPEE